MLRAATHALRGMAGGCSVRETVRSGACDGLQSPGGPSAECQRFHHSAAVRKAPIEIISVVQPEQSVEMPRKNEKPLSVLLRASFFGCLFILALLAWLPGAVMTRTMLGTHSEHFVAYLGTSISMGMAFQRSPRLTMQCVLLVAYAAILEAGQLYSPGRHASFQDFAYGAAGVVSGTLLLSVARARVLGWLGLD